MKYSSLSFLALLFVLNSCSGRHKPKVSSTLYMELNRTNQSKHELCIDQQKNLILKSFKESEQADLDDEKYHFIRNESLALEVLKTFELNKFTLKENKEEYEAMLMGCVEKQDPAHIICDSLFNTYKFFRALIHGMNQYQWSDSTKIKARNLILNYTKMVASHEASIMDIMLANDLILRLSNRKYLPNTYYQNGLAIKHQAEAGLKDLKKNFRKIQKSKKDFTCEDAIKFYQEERVKVKDLTIKFTSALSGKI